MKREDGVSEWTAPAELNLACKNLGKSYIVEKFAKNEYELC